MPPKKNMNAGMEQQIRQLQAQMRKLSAPSSAQVPQARKKKKKRVNRASGNAATVTLQHTELVADIALPAGKGSASGSIKFELDSMGVVLKKFGAIYDTYRVLNVSFRFISSSSAMKNGSFSMGCDYSSSSIPAAITKSLILPCSPHYSGPLFKGGSLKVPSQIIKPDLIRRTHGTSEDDIPFVLLWYADSETTKDVLSLGYIEASYSVAFSGIRP